MRQTVILLLLFYCVLQSARAQITDRLRAREIMRTLIGRYTGQSNLSFSITYRYAAEDRPGLYLDSLKGSFELSGDRYRYVLAGTEYIGTKDLSLILFREDKMIFLARPTATPVMNNPLLLMDSLLWRNDSIGCRVEETADQQKVIFIFPPGKSIKRMEYLVDRKSGMMTRMINTINSRQLYDPSVQSLVKGVSSFVNVEVELNDYRRDAFAGNELEPGRYVKKEGNQYVAVAPYESYKIFLSTPDL
jgi:hypothetical protein